MKPEEMTLEELCVAVDGMPDIGSRAGYSLRGDCIRELAKRCREQAKRLEWKTVQDRMPEPGECVVLYQQSDTDKPWGAPFAKIGSFIFSLNRWNTQGDNEKSVAYFQLPPRKPEHS